METKKKKGFLKSALYRQKSVKSVDMQKKRDERSDERPLTKKVDTVKLREKHFNTSYGRTVQKAQDEGASFINALRYANLLIRNKPSFGMRRNIYGAIKKGDVQNANSS